MIFQQGAFQIDPNLSPQEIARKREALAAAAPRYGDADTIGEGIGQLLTGITQGIQRRKLNEVERKGREGATSIFDNLINGASSNPAAGGPMTILGMPPASAPSGASADTIRQGLIERGLPEHVADGFLMNFKDESGLNPGINERNPIVPGSRGGFGLAQWTGPRRKQLEAFAQATGRPVDDLNLQLDFLMQELGGSESAAAKNILASQDAGGAAAAIVNDFLRPAEEHRARRVAQYTGGSQRQDTSQLYAALSNPWLTPQQQAIIQSRIQQAEQANDPYRQLQTEKLRIDIENARNPQTYRQVTGEEAAAMGLDPTKAYNVAPDRKATPVSGGGVTVNNHMGSDQPGRYIYAEDAGLPKGWRFDTQKQMAERIPGGPDDVEKQEADEKQANKESQAKLKLGTSLTSLNLNIAEIENGGLPVAGALGGLRRTGLGQLLTGSSAVDFENRTNQITDSAAFSEIQNMRDNSPTGGAVGQLTDKERAAIGNAVTALNSSTSAEEYLRAAKAYRELSLDLAFGAGEWRLDEGGSVTLRDGTVIASGIDSFPDVSSMSVSEIGEFMKSSPSKSWTPQQRATVAARLRELQ